MTTPQEKFLTISAQKIQESVSKIEADNRAISEEKFLDLKAQKIETDKKNEELTTLKENRTQRNKYAERIYYLVMVWLILLFLLIIADGIRFKSLDISDGVLIAFVGGTTANVLGLFALVLKYLFNPNQSKK